MRHSQTSTKQGHQLIQRFSTSGPFMHCPRSPTGTSAMSGKHCGVSQLCVEVTGIQWVETRAAAEHPPVHPHKPSGLKVHEPRGCRTLGWVVSKETSNCTILRFPCWGLHLPDHWLEGVTTHSCLPSWPPGEGLPLPQHCQDSDQANAPPPSPLQATQTRRTEPHNHYESH